MTAPQPATPPARAAIIGGGPIGLTCALMLAQRGLPVEVVEARPAGERGAPGDRRLLALSRGTLEMLAQVGVAQLPSAPIREVHVCSAGEFGSVRMTAGELGGALLGATIHQGELLAALEARVAADARIRVRRPRRVTALAQGAAAATLTLDDGSLLRSPVVVSAEGGVDAAAGGTRAVPVALRADAALCADLEVDGPAAGLAIERFTRDGPLALLPLPGRDASGAGRALALIWCMPRALAESRLQLDDAAFRGALDAALGVRLGRVRATGPRTLVALRQQLRTGLRAHRVVYVGNAAQQLHPVMGQGFNLGVRDCAALADCLGAAANGHDDAADAQDVVAALARYAQRRQVDRRAIGTLTAHLPELFAARFAPLAAARSAALMTLGAVRPLRREFARLLVFGVRA